MGNANPDMPVTRRGTNPKYDASYRAAVKAAQGQVNPYYAKYPPFSTPPMSTGKGVTTPTGVNRTGVEKVGRGGGIRGLGRKIFGER
jgi:hypothetical protein